MAVSILGISVDDISPAEVLVELRKRLQAGERTQVITVNNELVMRARHDMAYREAVNAADLKLPDSAGIIWAAAYQCKPAGGAIRSRVRAARTLLQLLVAPRSLRGPLSQTIPGSDLTVDVAGMAMEFGYRVYLLGAAEGVAEAAAEELQQRFPGVQIAGAERGGSGEPVDDAVTRERITTSGAQILLVAYGQPKQDLWIARNLQHLPAPLLAIGVGGSFDYLVGGVAEGSTKAAKQPPAVVRRRGLEWLWRLVTQPARWRRIVTALPHFVSVVVRHHRSHR